MSGPPPPASGSAPPAEGGEWDAHLDSVLGQLQTFYRQSVEPVEKKFEYDTFRPSWFGETIVQKKPFITFLGPFSAGKSTFINYLMQSNYLLTGPQPVTDKFTVIMHGEEVQQIPGRVLVSDSSQPFRGLQQFGDSFLECFQGVLAPHPILRSVNVIDTPGVLEAAGDIHSRRYDYVKVCRWFVEKSDLVFFLFDPTKLDAGMELRMLFKHALRGFENRIRIVLNKADTVGPQELMRVYGSLFWNLSNLIGTTEPPRVYVSSFWDQPYKPGTNHELFTDEKSDLLYDLIEVVPVQSLDKRVTSVLRRCQQVLIHTLVVSAIRSKMPRMFGKDKAKKEALAQLPQTYVDLAAKWKLSENDFPDPEEYVKFLEKFDISNFPDQSDVEKKKWALTLKKLIDQDLPALLKPIKTGATADPRDRKNAIMIQRQYQEQLQAQLAGQAGVQGGLGEMKAANHMQNLIVNQAQPGTAPVAPAQPAMDPQQQALLLQMQMLQQQQAMAGGAPAAQPMMPQVPVAPAPAPAPAAQPQMTPEMMAMMQQMMAQQQAQQQQ